MIPVIYSNVYKRKNIKMDVGMVIFKKSKHVRFKNIVNYDGEL